MAAELQMLTFALTLDVLGVWTLKRWTAAVPRGARRKIMAWTILLLAAMLEVVWLIALKKSDAFANTWQGVLSIGVSWLSFFMLAWALKVIPAGTAYAVWTGCGAAGGAVAGMILFGESRSALRLASIFLILVGIVGVKLADQRLPAEGG